ncbi:hypothetical protein M0R45_035351 [Rubus argutus]|uniref:Uncharacterized protein n=1 Tax=Rubus argutus TaxID=59490 RepID=A0AAW1VWQ5_RUBAR
MATSYPSLTSIAISILFLFLPVLSYAQVHGHHHGAVISLNMIHRDAPSSPLYNSSQTNWQRVSNALWTFTSSQPPSELIK